MNYFELFNIPISFNPNLSDVKNKFYALSRKFHPDFFTQATQDEQQYALEQSALINKAYKILNNQESVLKYILELNNLIEDEEKYKLPPNFLMQVMDLNEQLLDAKLEQDESKVNLVVNEINNFKTSIYEPVKSLLENCKEIIYSREELLQIKDFYYKKKYLNRILAGLH
ncbi:MAG TPA: Fe-S protein assembly co-chaperone HscB [Chitinophagaceae bacterium]|nr:Fe-S protein assembly co-chaperone HscB [Chitinophagaceae bacterium]MCC6634501.1 Fe-S protein assembly co-chaperone HscB [Chitinophagaceae bacterium]HMZ45779.1 Fe-S protein assembly co-chaperone HscB [Chitinophagaceae bacterium]HNE93384.1 Fe-S protein assembly co-chaperone HscB [Chitinophagaceae bacterium]HNF29233.1 Fe-S protein assembly co-chaperone HscB [Chitinophagaceae bacterium]